MRHLHQVFLLFPCLLPAFSSVGMVSDVESLLQRMNKAYVDLQDYQGRLEVRTVKRDGTFEIKKLLYTFKKPHWIRLDFLSPHPGLVLVYPDKNGKVVIQPSGWTRFFRLRLKPDNPLLQVAPEQRIDQTDLGLLIKNISQSLTEGARSQAAISEDEIKISIRVLADNHFRDDVVTSYQFHIDKKLWLPVGLKESTSDRTLERRVIFRTLRVNIGVQDSVFQLDGE